MVGETSKRDNDPINPADQAPQPTNPDVGGFSEQTEATEKIEKLNFERVSRYFLSHKEDFKFIKENFTEKPETWTEKERMQGSIDQLYATHCTYGTSAIERKTGDDTKKRVLGYSARATSLEPNKIKENFRTIERVLYYYLPNDTPPEKKKTLTAKDAPERLVYCPSLSGIKVAGRISYRTTDTAGRVGSYFAHIIEGPQLPDPLNVLRSFDSDGWQTEDNPQFDWKIPEAGLEETLNQGKHSAINDQAFVRFLTAKKGEELNDAESRSPNLIPERWQEMKPEGRKEAFTKALAGYLQLKINGDKRKHLLFGIEPEMAAFFYYAILRLMPEKVRKETSFSTHETVPDKPMTELAAVAGYNGGDPKFLDRIYNGNDVVYNTYDSTISKIDPKIKKMAKEIIAELLNPNPVEAQPVQLTLEQKRALAEQEKNKEKIEELLLEINKILEDNIKNSKKYAPNQIQLFINTKSKIEEAMKTGDFSEFDEKKINALKSLIKMAKKSAVAPQKPVAPPTSRPTPTPTPAPVVATPSVVPQVEQQSVQTPEASAPATPEANAPQTEQSKPPEKQPKSEKQPTQEDKDKLEREKQERKLRLLEKIDNFLSKQDEILQFFDEDKDLQKRWSIIINGVKMIPKEIDRYAEDKERINKFIEYIDKHLEEFENAKKVKKEKEAPVSRPVITGRQKEKSKNKAWKWATGGVVLLSSIVGSIIGVEKIIDKAGGKKPETPPTSSAPKESGPTEAQNTPASPITKPQGPINKPSVAPEQQAMEMEGQKAWTDEEIYKIIKEEKIRQKAEAEAKEKAQQQFQTPEYKEAEKKFHEALEQPKSKQMSAEEKKEAESRLRKERIYKDLVDKRARYEKEKKENETKQGLKRKQIYSPLTEVERRFVEDYEAIESERIKNEETLLSKDQILLKRADMIEKELSENSEKLKDILNQMRILILELKNQAEEYKKYSSNSAVQKSTDDLITAADNAINIIKDYKEKAES